MVSSIGYSLGIGSGLDITTLVNNLAAAEKAPKEALIKRREDANAAKISALADSHGTMVVPHGSSVYSYHFVVTRTNSPFAEFLMMHETAEEVVPMFSPLLLNEPVPVNGRLVVPETPGFGVELNPEVARDRPFTH